MPRAAVAPTPCRQLQRSSCGRRHGVAVGAGEPPRQRLAGQAVTWQREAGQRLLANGTEYLVEERGLLPAKGELAVFGHDVDRLRDDLARLEKRLQRLNEQSRSK